MTVSSFRKMLKQLKANPVKMQKYLKHSTPKDRKYGKFMKKCLKCGGNKGFVSKYSINLCRRCFRDIAPSMGFRKYS